MAKLEGKVAVVTGATSGIGRAIAELFVSEGARVAIFARDAKALDDLVGRHHQALLSFAGDISREEDVERLFNETERRFGRCEILVNNAGMVDPVALVDCAPHRWQRTIDVNVNGVFLASRRALPAMIEKKSGVIVNIASISGVPGTEKFPGFTSYCASKAAVILLTEALAVEVREHGIRVNAVSPGSVDTPMWARVSGGAPASMTPQEVAKTVLFLASDDSRPINGQNLDVYSA